MAAALRALPDQPRPSEVYIPGLLDGLDVIRAPLRRASRRARERSSRSTRRPNRALHDGPAGRAGASPSWSRAIRGCRRPSSRRRSWRSRSAASRSRSGRCAIRPSEQVHPMHQRIRRHGALSARIPLPGAAARAARPRLEPAAAADSAMLLRLFWRDLRRDPTPNRGRRLGQAFVLARELRRRQSAICTSITCTRPPRSSATPPSSPAAPGPSRRTPRTSGRRRTGRSARSSPTRLWGVTCTRAGRAPSRRRLRREPARVALAYHGLDLSRFPAPPERPPGAGRLRSGRSGPDRLGRARGREEGLRRSSPGAWRRFRRTCIGASPMSAAASCWNELKARAQAAGIAEQGRVPRRAGRSRR